MALTAIGVIFTIIDKNWNKNNLINFILLYIYMKNLNKNLNTILNFETNYGIEEIDIQEWKAIH